MQVLIDIGSTVVKVVELDDRGGVAAHRFLDRNYDIEICDQVMPVLRDYRARDPGCRFRICSSANGGLRLGILALTERFSGRTTMNLVQAAGGNVLFVHVLGRPAEAVEPVDVLAVVGGVNGPDMPRLKAKLARADLSAYRFKTLLYAGNRHLYAEFAARHPQAVRVENPQGSGLKLGSEALLDWVRRLYLEDLIDTQGVSRLQPLSEVPIWPTPGVVNAACERSHEGGVLSAFPPPILLVDIGGATTDVHFTQDLVDTSDGGRAGGFRSSNRHVFTELGVFASRKSTEGRLASDGRLYEFLQAVYAGDASRRYAELKEGEVGEDLLFYACFFLALDRMTRDGPVLVPRLAVAKAKSIVITGGASQRVDPAVLARILALLVGARASKAVRFFLDRDYRIWVDGLKGLDSRPERPEGASA
jgi:hypothetical protein